MASLLATPPTPTSVEPQLAPVQPVAPVPQTAPPAPAPQGAAALPSDRIALAVWLVGAATLALLLVKDLVAALFSGW